MALTDSMKRSMWMVCKASEAFKFTRPTMFMYVMSIETRLASERPYAPGNGADVVHMKKKIIFFF